MEVPKDIPSPSELHFLLVDQLNHIGVTQVEEVMMQGIEETPSEAFELGFQSAITGMKSALFHSLMMALIDIMHKGNLDTIFMKSFDRLSYAETFMHALVEKGHRHPAVAQNLNERLRRTTK